MTARVTLYGWAANAEWQGRRLGWSSLPAKARFLLLVRLANIFTEKSKKADISTNNNPATGDSTVTVKHGSNGFAILTNVLGCKRIIVFGSRVLTKTDCDDHRIRPVRLTVTVHFKVPADKRVGISSAIPGLLVRPAVDELSVDCFTLGCAVSAISACLAASRAEGRARDAKNKHTHIGLLLLKEQRALDLAIQKSGGLSQLDSALLLNQFQGTWTTQISNAVGCRRSFGTSPK